MASVTVNLLETTHISPSQPQLTQPTSLPLTPLDMLFLGFPPVERLFFFKPSQPSTPFQLHIHHLKTSLSLALRHFYPLAGKLHFSPESQKPAIHSTAGDSVSFSVAETNSDFYHLSNDHPKEGSDFQSLVPSLPCFDSPAPVLSIQVTGFTNSGYCIGVSMNHAVADGRSFVHFIKCWSELCRNITTAQPQIENLVEPPCFNRETLLGFTDMEKKLAGGFSGFSKYRKDISIESISDPPLFRRATFTLSYSDILKLKKLSGKTQKSISTFVVVCAYTWVCSVRACRWQEDDRKVGFGFTADCRSRLDPPLPDSYFGSCVRPCVAEAIVSEMLGENGFSVAAMAIDDAVTGLRNGIFRDVETWVSRVFDFLPGRLLSVAGSPKFGVYGIDFGWGKPNKVEIVSIGKTGAMSLAESRDGGGGVEIGLSLPRSEMELFVSHIVGGLKALV